MAKVNTSKFQKRMATAKKVKPNVMKKAFDYFRKLTPVDTGNAKRNTTLTSDYVIEADYPYAFVLDKGRHMTSKGARGSKQAPQGMTNPTVRKFKEWVRNFIKVI